MKSRFVIGICLSALLGSTANAHIYDFIFGMSGRAVVPPTDSTASGFGTLGFNHHTFNYDLDLLIVGIELDDLLPVGPNGTPLHIYHAPSGQTGDIVLDPGSFGDFVQDGDNIRITLSDVRLGGQQGAFSSSIFENTDSLYDGHLYIQLFTQQYPAGEIRGQIPPFGRWLGTIGPGGFADMDGPPVPVQIPTPAVPAAFALVGLFAARRRR